MPAPLLWIVVPCFNEAEVLPITAPLFRETLETMKGEGIISYASKILFVDDGSQDGTWEVIESLSSCDSVYVGIGLSRNRGHQNALLAGLMECRTHCDIAVSIDCDGQDDVSKIRDMVLAYVDGYDVVYGVRSSRDTDSFFKRTTAQSFYRLLSSMGVETVYNHADYRLMSKRAIDGLAEFEEVNLFLRGMVPLVGFPSTKVEYRRVERLAGSSHYPLRKMLHLAFDGITSLSTKPIEIIVLMGVIFSFVGLVGIVWAIATALLGGATQGWSSLVCIVCLLGGLQLFALGIIGEYVGKAYLEAKHRPRFIVAKRTQECE